AIEQFRTHRPDITLRDLQMPLVSGGEAIVAIREEFPNARIIVLTTYTGDAQADRAFKAGAYGDLLKSMLRRNCLKPFAPCIAAKEKSHRKSPSNLQNITRTTL